MKPWTPEEEKIVRETNAELTGPDWWGAENMAKALATIDELRNALKAAREAEPANPALSDEYRQGWQDALAFFDSDTHI